MMLGRFLLVTAVCIALTPGVAPAVLVTFDFAIPAGSNQAGKDLDQDSLYTNDLTVESTHVSETTNVVAGSATFTLTGGTAGPSNNDFFNYTAVSGNGPPNFGINRDGTFADSSNQLDNGGGGTHEKMIFSVNANVVFNKYTLVSIDFDRFGGSDEVRIIFAGDTNVVYDNSDLDGNDLLTLDQDFTAGQNITIEVEGGSAFGLEAITIEAVPEPSAFLFGGLICSIIGIGYARRSLFGKSEQISENNETDT